MLAFTVLALTVQEHHGLRLVYKQGEYTSKPTSQYNFASGNLYLTARVLWNRIRDGLANIS